MPFATVRKRRVINSLIYSSAKQKSKTHQVIASNWPVCLNLACPERFEPTPSALTSLLDGEFTVPLQNLPLLN